MTGPPAEFPRLSDSDFDLVTGLGDEQENAALRDLIVAEIRAAGPITFRRFMELALYHPIEGYYSSSPNRVGRSGDYVTSPELTPLFGYALARQISEFWLAFGRPDHFALIEPGAGNGRLARDVLRWLQRHTPDLYAALTYTLVERSRPLRTVQGEVLAPEIGQGKVRLESAMPEGAAEQGCVLANELLDAFPVHRVARRDGRLYEIYVGTRDAGFVELLGPPSTPDLGAYFERIGILPAEGCLAEVCLETRSWLASCSKSLARGYLLLLDYGYQAERKYAAWRRMGTLLCYHRHQATEDPYRLVGRQDLTAHVDLTSVTLDGRDADFRRLALTTQSRFLAGLGIGASVGLPASGPGAMDAYYARRRAVSALLDPNGLGRIAVLLLGKHAPVCPFRGFSAGECRGSL